MTAAGRDGDSPLRSLDVIVVAGGRGSRLGGLDKSALVYAGEPLRRHVLRSIRSARRVAWVGDSTPDLGRDSWPGVRVTREQPAFAGPAAAVAAGLAALADDPAPFTLILAADLPLAGVAVAELLRRFDDSADGILAVDETGRRQFLLGVYRTAALHAQVDVRASAGPLDGLPLRRLLEPLYLTEVPLAAGLCADVDTAEDAARYGIRLPSLSDRRTTP